VPHPVSGRPVTGAQRTISHRGGATEARDEVPHPVSGRPTGRVADRGENQQFSKYAGIGQGADLFACHSLSSSLTFPQAARHSYGVGAVR
jgi:hypothetical protein